MLSRKLWFNTIRGFEDATVQTGEYQLAKCMGTTATVTPTGHSRSASWPFPAA